MSRMLRLWRLGAIALVLLSFDAKAGPVARWAMGPNLSVAREVPSGAFLRDGRVLITGGSPSLSSCEIYDPRRRNVSPAAAMGRARVFHTATTLRDGRVLVVGGNDTVQVHADAEIYDDRTNSWTATLGFAGGRNRHTATLLPNGHVLIIGGEDFGGNATNSVLRYDPALHQFVAEPPLPAPRANHIAILLTDGHVVVAGGESAVGAAAADTFVRAPDGTWVTAGNLSRFRLDHTGTLLPGYGILAAGSDGSPVDGTAELFNLSTGIWTPVEPMNEARNNAGAVIRPDGTMLVIGGAGVINKAATTELYNAGSNTWQVLGTNTVHRSHLLAVALPTGQVLAIGGRGPSNVPLASTETFIATVENWLPGSTVPERSESQAVVLPPTQEVLVVGGRGPQPLASTDLHDSSGSVQAGPSLLTARAAFTLTLLRSGDALATGGATPGGVTASAELFDTNARAFVAVQPMSSPRTSHSAAPLPSGRILVAGGFDATSSALASAEIFDPSSRVFAPAAPMSTPRAGFALVALDDGRVLAIGGDTGAGATGNIEAYDETSDTWTPFATLLVARTQHTATVVGGRVTVVGGRNGSGVHGSTELVDPNGSVTMGPVLTDARFAHAAVVQANGRLVVMGGLDSGLAALDSVEINDPTANDWIPMAFMAGARDRPIAVLEPVGGTVLVSGGTGTTNVERYVTDNGTGSPSRPSITSVTPVGGGRWRVAGVTLTGVTEGSAGNYQSVNSVLPFLFVREAQSDRVESIPLDAWTATQADFDGSRLRAGWYWMTTVVNGVPSAAFPFRVGSVLGGSCGADAPCLEGFCGAGICSGGGSTGTAELLGRQYTVACACGVGDPFAGPAAVWLVLGVMAAARVRRRR